MDFFQGALSRSLISIKCLHCTISFTDNIMQTEEGHSEKLPLLLPLLNYERCMERSFLSTNIYDNETKLLHNCINVTGKSKD